MLAFVLACATVLLLLRARRPDAQARRLVGAASLAGVAAIVALPPMPMVAKLVGLLAMPTGLLWLILLASMAALTDANRPRPAAAVFAFWLLYTCAGNTWLGSSWLGAMERDIVMTDPFAERLDAVFVLGGGASTSPSGRAQTGEAGDRVVLAARLYHAGITEALVASGSNVPGANAVDDLAAATASIWTQLGVPPSAIIQVPGPYDTRSEIAAYAELTRDRGWNRVGVVSSAWHLPRAQVHADPLGFEFTPLAADIRGNPTWEGIVSLVPSGAGFAQVSVAAWEALGRLTRQ